MGVTFMCGDGMKVASLDFRLEVLENHCSIIAHKQVRLFCFVFNIHKPILRLFLITYMKTISYNHMLFKLSGKNCNLSDGKLYELRCA